VQNIFISHPTPYNEYQVGFLVLIEAKLKEYDLNPVNLGKNNWDFRCPLEPIREMMNTCKAAMIIGLERNHSYIGYEKEFSKDSNELIHKYTTSPWIQIEAGMAYQANLPLLILKEKKLYSEGILDPNLSEYYVFEFEVEKMHKTLSHELNEFLLSWVNHVKSTK